ncbi:MAG: ZIP family metal transporter [Candidatus Paceibacterota bacterium]
MLQILLFSVLVMIASLSGVFVVWKKVGKVIERNLRFLVSLSAGVFLVIAFQLSRETIEHASNLNIGLLWILAGTFLIFLLFKFLPGFHHHHDEKDENKKHSKIDARRILLSDGIHNIGDGFLLTVSFMVNPAFGMLTTISIFIHEFVQEISEFFVLRQAGYSIKKSLLINFAVSSTLLIGSIGGYFLLDLFEILEVPLLGIAAGSFLVVVFLDLIPHSIRESETKTHYLKHIGWFLIGALLMIAVNNLTVHSHEVGVHEDDHGHSHEAEMIDDHHEDEDHHEDIEHTH